VAGLPEEGVLTELYVGQNRLTHLGSFAAQSFPKLNKLDLQENGISEVKELAHLRKLGATLRDLRLSGNPIAELETYKSDVLINLPLLKVLDGEPITDEDVQAAKELVAAREEEARQKAAEEAEAAAAAAAAAAEAAAAEAAAAGEATTEEEAAE
jgi:hypothetical protein